MRMLEYLIASSLFAVSHALAATAPSANGVITDLSRCDSRFFSTLSERSADFSDNPSFRLRGPVGYFQVPNRLGQASSRIMFPSPQLIGSVTVAGYFDEMWSFDQGYMISWGFLVQGPVAQVMTATKAAIWQSERVRDVDSVYVRSELWSHQQHDRGWQQITTVSNRPPEPGTVERVLLIEPFEDDPGLSRFGCSLQGAVTREMLERHRPDIGLQP